MVRLCVQLFGSAAARVPSFSVLRLSTVRVCVQPALLRGTEVPNLHYSGIALNSAGPALYRAPALLNLHYSGPSTADVNGFADENMKTRKKSRCLLGGIQRPRYLLGSIQY